MAILIDETKRVLVQGITGREGRARTKLMREYGTNVVAGVTPGKGGQTVLGVPVFSTFAGRLGAVDERLIGEGRLHRLLDADHLDLDFRAKRRSQTRVRRDPGVLVQLLLSPLIP